ncbi:hypothetical protein E2C06_03875 [Dankookia rubra]|uniref:histidine kinase n=1 Tax=Dankookia rubra TaxID=1442381 RepID=A0A4R5QLH1_9PROT|nr:HWE histidine kinase domain-containing protein [Dankookia rubra]TDH63973.1 hypothetical protein E2C06_03875 [Dankookia rubra]
MAFALLPTLTVSAVAVGLALSAYHQAFEDRLTSAARAAASAVDRVLEGHLNSLETLATNPLLDLNEDGEFAGLAGFYQRMIRASAILGTPVTLIGRNGHYILHTDRPFAGPLPAAHMRDAIDRVIQTGQPVVGHLSQEPLGQALVVPVLVPVQRSGQVIAILGTPVSPGRLSRVLADQSLQAARFAAVSDPSGTIVADFPPQHHGSAAHASDWLLRAAERETSGFVQGPSSITRGQVAIAFKRSSVGDRWLTVVGEPAFGSSVAVQLPVLVIALGGGIVIVVAFVCAGRIGRRLLVDVDMLTQQASALASDKTKASLEASPDPSSAIRAGATVAEFADLSKAMTRADEALRDREHRQMLLVREVDHRAKNALAVVQSLVRLTPGDNARTFKHAVQGRVDALARAHSVLAKHGWRATELKELLEAEFAPYKHAASLIGPAVAVTATAAQPIAMVMHELATNAAKYGAFSVMGGAVAVTWRIAGDHLHLRWREHGGPPVTEKPVQRGFGSRMIGASIERQLGGTVLMSWDQFFECEISLPLERVIGKDPHASPETKILFGSSVC